MKFKLERPLHLLGGDELEVTVVAQTDAALRFCFVGSREGAPKSAEHTISLVPGAPVETQIAEALTRWIGIKASPA